MQTPDTQTVPKMQRKLHDMEHGEYFRPNMKVYMTQGKIDLRNESGRPMKVKVVGEVSEK